MANTKENMHVDIGLRGLKELDGLVASVSVT